MFRLFSHKLKNAMPKLHLSAEALLDPASQVCMSQMEPVMVEALAWQSVWGSESCTGGRLPPRPRLDTGGGCEAGDE